VQTPQLIYEYEGWEIDPTRRELRVGGKPVFIGGRAFEIVEILVRSAGQLVTKDELMDRVWRGAIVEENTLQVHISALRKLLGGDRELLKTTSGRGYRLLGNWIAREAGASATSVEARAERTTAPPAQGNVPTIAVELMGRSDAMNRVRDLLSVHRAVTLTGPGGIGKTALALEVARAQLSLDGEGWLIELASLSDPGLVLSAVASVLGLRMAGSEISAEKVARSIGDRKLLLLLDNCEHVVEMAAEVAEAVWRHCPNATVLATSREVLRIAGEQVYRVLPLEVPPPDQDAPSALLGHSAVQLFLARMAALATDLAADAASLSTIAAICRRVDGIPLAIEFAAARAATLGLSQVARLLDDRFRLLTGGRRTALPRHQTLRATLDWSHGLLTGPERVLFHRLAIFAGSFSLEAACEVAASPELRASDVIDGISSLAAKSLVAADVGGDARYRLLDTTRAYAFEKLSESGEREGIARCHAAYYRDLFERAEVEWEVRSTAEWIGEYEWRIDNLRAALDWAFSADGDPTLSVELTAAAIPLWMQLSLLDECRGRLEKALAALRPGANRDARREMKLHAALAASLRYTRGAVSETGAAWTKALEIAESLEDPEYQLQALWGLWLFHTTSSRHRIALDLAQRLCTLAECWPDLSDRLIGERAMSTSQHYLGDQSKARHHIERVLADCVIADARPHLIRFQIDLRVMARVFFARVLWLQGFPDEAMRVAERSVEDARAANHAISLCYALFLGACPIALSVGALVAAEHYVSMLLDDSTRFALPFWVARGRSYQGALVIKRGDIDAGLPLLRAGFDELGEARSAVFGLIELLLPEALGGVGQVAEGLAAIEDAMNHSETTQERWMIAEMLRIKGELLLLQGGATAATAAEDHFRQALDWAARQGALSWELRAAMSLAGLLRDQGRSADAKRLLQPVYDRFTEGFDTTDLKKAKALLDSFVPAEVPWPN
jgi:predicted ATPase/DNA-binding winged helix-turn-helix (wHTH) protein